MATAADITDLDIPDELRAFVRRLCLKKYSDAQVKAVAQGTRWKTWLGEIDDLLELRGDRWRRMA